MKELRTSLNIDNKTIENRTEELRKSEERYHSIINEVKDYAIFLIDIQGNILTWNLGAERIKGYLESEIVGKNFRLFYTHDELRESLPEKLLLEASTTGSASHEGWRVRKDHSHFWGSVTITALHDENGAILGFLKLTRDLTKWKISEDEKIALTQELTAKNIKLINQNIALERTNAELSLFSHIASHDLQEPLRKIRVTISKIFDDGGTLLPEIIYKNLCRIQKSASRMQELIIDLVTYTQSNRDENKFLSTDLNSIVADSIFDLNIVINERKAEIIFSGLPTVQAIPSQMRQLFINLISNSIKFSKPDAKPVIIISSVIVGTNQIPFQNMSSKKKEFYRITLHDNGIGFGEEYKEKIFGLFQKLHPRDEYSGTGLGLAICKRIIENHHGHITAESSEGSSASFHIYLPI